MKFIAEDELLKRCDIRETDDGVYIHSAPIVTPTFVNSLPAADAVPKSVYDQVCWERDTALAQLKEIGKSLGEKMDDVKKVRHGNWEYNGMVWVWNCSECGENPTRGMGYTQGRNELYDYCPRCGAKMSGGSDEE